VRYLCLLALALAAVPASAGVFSPDERAAMGAELRAYLTEHPEVIAEALGGAEERRYAQEARGDLALLGENADALFHSAQDWTGGNPEGDVTLVGFIDYGSKASARALAAARALLASDPGLRLVVKDTPPEGEDTAARFAQAALRLGGSDAYVRAQDALFAAPDVARPTLDGIARDLGLDPAAVAAAMTAPETGTVLAANRALARTLDLGPAPAYVLDRTMIRGDLPPVALARIVEQMRRKK